MKKIVKPINLKENDIVSLQSLASGLAGEKSIKHRYLIGKNGLKDVFRINLQTSPNALKGIKTLLENPQLRAQDFNDAILNKEVKAIFANIGGNDSHHLHAFIDLEKIVQNPKILMGYSDTTSMHFLMYKAGIQSYYGPSVLSGIAENVKMHEYTGKSISQVLFKNEKQVFRTNASYWTSELLEWNDPKNNSIQRKMTREKHNLIWINKKEQTIQGHLLGGCIDSFSKTQKTPIWPSLKEWKDAVIFIETSECKPIPKEYQKYIDNLSNEISVCKAVIVAKPKDETYFWEYLEILKQLDKPIIYNFNFGHTAPVFVIPYGAKALIDFKNEIFTIDNS